MNFDLLKSAITLGLICVFTLTIHEIWKSIPWWKLTILRRLMTAQQFSDLYTRTEWIIPLERTSGEQNLAPIFSDVHGHCWADMTTLMPKTAQNKVPWQPSK